MSQATIVAASTTWGLFLLVLMLGYGLVEVPLNIYNHSRTAYMLSHTQFKLAKIYDEKINVEERLDSLVDDVTKSCMEIKTNDPLRRDLEQIIKIVPEQYSNRIKLTMEDYENNRIAIANRFSNSETEKQLIKLHERLKKYIHVHHRVQVLWTRTINEAFYLEDILNNEQNTNHEFIKQNPHPSSWLRKKLFDQHTKFEWYTYCFIRPWALRLLGIILGIISILVIWSEMTFFSTKPVLSILAQCVNAARDHYSYFIMEVFCCLSIAYLCFCAYYTIFHIRVLDYFYLSLYHLTDDNSLIFAATFLCRLTAPLSYNFLGMIHLDQAITKKTDRKETIFTSIMGHLTAIPIVSIGFNFYFPMLILLLSIGTYFRLGSRCLHACGFEQFLDDDQRRSYGGANELSNTTTAVQRRDRRRELEEKYGIRSTSAMGGNNFHRHNINNSETRPLRSSDDDNEPLLNTLPNATARSGK
ncbi:unnamed protein product [Rotaria sp. Silwood2]|nr:unnamed protein product [Rotaria sp. Silwood2]